MNSEQIVSFFRSGWGQWDVVCKHLEMVDKSKTFILLPLFTDHVIIHLGGNSDVTVVQFLHTIEFTEIFINEIKVSHN